MKKYMQFLLITALILGIACAVKDHYLTNVPTDNGNAFFQTADNSELPWELILINGQNRIPENFDVDLKETLNGEQVDKRIYIYLEEMISDAVKAGHSPEITSGYRSKEKQQEIFDDKVKEFRNTGHSKKDSKKLTAEQVAEPGYSEHETGLAVDINSENGDSWKLYGWLKENCFRYGFIVRYPYEKEYITGISYEPWHLRFVGKKAAEYIYINDITLEEYLFSE